jgi:hypothetical protein
VDPVDVDAWRREGLGLAHDLQHDLGADIEVLYFDVRNGMSPSLDDRQLWS